ncbi:hypothetical protein BC629DRAFT_1583255 [Irpex lacteus]|nr:hypothetical protein BC629DRAFT_1583255 [Irpex lacteus]
MSEFSLITDKSTKRVGPFAIRDFPPPPDVKDYTTLIILHGFAWHSIFMRLVPFAEQKNCRLVLVNRRDYPDATAAEALSELLLYTKVRAQEFHDFLCTFIQNETIAEDSVVVAGWSFAHAPSLSTGGLKLPRYIKHVVWYGPPAISLGYPPPPQFYNPLTDPSYPPGEGVRYFNTWVTGYYDHGESLEKLEQRTILQSPPPTISTMTPDDLASVLYAAPANSGGSDNLFMVGAARHGFWATLRKAALLISPLSSEAPKEWGNIELHYIWCDQSAWESPWATVSLRAELEEAKKVGKRVREVTMTRIRKANTFAHWDQPERALGAFLSTVPEI